MIGLEMNNFVVLNGMIAQATTELFGDYAFPVEYIGTAEERPELAQIAGLIGFCGDELTGTLALATSRRVIEAKAAATPGVVSSTDWLSELTNQLLGRLKRLLLDRSATICLGTPVAVSGECLDFGAKASGPAPTCSFFSSSEGTIMVWLDARFAVEFDLRPTAGEDGGVNAGETIFF